MSNRSLNGISVGGSRTLNGLVSTAIEITGEKPIIVSDSNGDKNITIDISTLDSATLGFTNNLLVQQGSVLKQTTLTNIRNLIAPSVEYDLPIVLSENTITFSIADLGDATLALSDNVFVQQGTALKKTTFTNIKTLIDSNTQYTVSSPLVLSSGNQISLSQALFATVNNDFASNDFIPYFKADGTTYRKIEREAFLTNINYLASSPLVKNTSTFTYELDFSSLVNVAELAGSDEILICTDGAKTFRHITFSTLIVHTQASLTFPTVNATIPLVKSVSGSTTTVIYDINTLLAAADSELLNTMLLNIGIVNGSNFLNRKITGLQLQNYINHQGLFFGTHTGISGTRIFGMINAPTTITGSTINVLTSMHCKFISSTVQNGQFTTGLSNGRIRLTSTSTSIDPVFELFSLNSSGSAKGHYIFGNANGDLNFATDNVVNYSIFLNRTQMNQLFWHTGGTTSAGQPVYFGNLRNGVPASGIYLTWGTDISATSGTHGWKIDIGETNGVLHFWYSSNLQSFTTIVGYIDKVRSSNNGGSGLMNFTAQHRCIPEDKDLYDNVNDYIGYVVETTGKYNSVIYETIEEKSITKEKTPAYIDPITNEYIEEVINDIPYTYQNTKEIITNEPTINESQPIVKLTTTAKSKKVFGVISAKEDGNNREFKVGVFTSNMGKREDNRLFINSVGEGAVLVCNQSGDIENGDLLCSSDIEGIAMKQDTDFIMNYTIGKATQDYNFIDSEERKLIGCVYYAG